MIHWDKEAILQELWGITVLKNIPDDFHALVFWQPVFENVVKLFVVYISLLSIPFPVL